MIELITSAKAWLEEYLHLDRDSLHIHVALILFFGTALLTKRPLSNWLPWFVVLIAALVGEAVDYMVQPRPFDWLRLAKRDVAATVLWPSIIALVARTRRLQLR